MPKPYSLKLIIRVLKDKGFFFISQKGSHAKYKKKGKPNLMVIVPMHSKEVPYGTFRSILRQANLAEKDFKRR